MKKIEQLFRQCLHYINNVFDNYCFAGIDVEYINNSEPLKVSQSKAVDSIKEKLNLFEITIKNQFE